MWVPCPAVPGYSRQHCPQKQQLQTWPAGHTPHGHTAEEPTASYLLGLGVLRAREGGLQALARELSHGGHCTCSDVTLRVSEKLLGERGCL